MNPILKMIRQDVKRALGCTEPVAIAYACAKAAQHSKGELSKLKLTLSGNIIKNVMGVGIPGTPFIGAKYAALLGFFKGEADKELRVLEAVQDEDIPEIRALYEQNLVEIQVYDGAQKLYVGVEALADNRVEVVLQEDHANIVLVKMDGVVLFEKEDGPADQSVDLPFYFSDIVQYALEAPLEDIAFLEEGVHLNKVLSDQGRTGYWGLQLGKQIEEQIELGILKEDLLTHMTIGVCAAVDARMDGAQSPAMTNSGSGNQGIITHLSPYFASLYLKSSHEELLRALVLSNAIPIYMKHRLGRLSALCGVTSAVSGVACAVAYLQGANAQQIELAIKNVLAGVSGMICDGAKPGCTLKVSSGIANALYAAALALHDRSVKGYEGIVDEKVEDCIHHYVRLGIEGMQETDRIILDTMVRKA